MNLSYHPINLTIRFLLEIAALISVGLWGKSQSSGWIGYVLAIILPVAFATAWGIFAVPDDPSRSGTAPIPTPGIIRLLLELGIFAFATWALFNLGHTKSALLLASITFLHYLVSYSRILWLLSR